MNLDGYHNDNIIIKTEVGSLRNIKGILFDKDGVLVDFSKTWDPVLFSITDILANGNAELRSELIRLAGYDEQQGRVLAGSIWGEGHLSDLVEVWLKSLPKVKQEQLLEVITDCCTSAVAVPLLGVEKLQNLFINLDSQGFLLGIATNDSADSAKGTMRSFGLEKNLSLILGYDSVVNPKPAPDPLWTFCQHCNIEADEVMMIGDNPHDMQMARSAGAGFAVGVLTGNSSRDDLAGLADVIIDSVLDLPTLLTTQ